MKKQGNTQEISHMLDKFMAGETTLPEEQQLAAYFRTHEVSAEWLAYKEMFALFDNGEVDIEPATAKPDRQFSRWFMTGIAASFIIVVGLGAWLYLKPNGQETALALQTAPTTQTVQEEESPLPPKHQEETAIAENQQVAIASPVRRSASAGTNPTPTPSSAGTNLPPNPVASLLTSEGKKREAPVEKTERETPIEETIVVYSDEALLAMSPSTVTPSEISARGERLMHIIEEKQRGQTPAETSTIFP